MFMGLMLMACSLAGQSPAVANDDLKLEIRRLVRQLDSDELAQRNAAEEALIKKGPEVIDLLPIANDRLSAEVRERLARVKQKVQQAAVEASVKPSLITLNGDAMPISKVLASIQEQSGNKIIDYRAQFGQPATDVELKINFYKMPFWQALDQVLDQAQLTIYPYGDEPGLNIVGRAPGQSLRVQNAVYSGPFRFEPVRLVAQREFGDSKTSSLHLTVDAAWEPRLKPIVLTQRLADIDAVDERGRPLAVESSEAELDMTVEGANSNIELMIPFVLPPREAKEIARLKGKLIAMIPGRIEEFKFNDLLKAKNVEKRQAGVTVTLDQVRKNNDAWEAMVRVKFDTPGDALASHRGWIFRNEAFLEAADGKKIAYDTMETTRQTEDEVGVSYIFVLEKPPADLKFIYKTPGAILGTTIDYELRNLERP
jgi:hypothetical protein